MEPDYTFHEVDLGTSDSQPRRSPISNTNTFPGVSRLTNLFQLNNQTPSLEQYAQETPSLNPPSHGEDSEILVKSVLESKGTKDNQIYGSKNKGSSIYTVVDFSHIVSIRVYWFDSIHGIRFDYDDNESVLFGKEHVNFSDFPLSKGEIVNAVKIRTGRHVDGIQFFTNLDKRSPMFGKYDGGREYLLEFEKYDRQIVGFVGTIDEWLLSIGVVGTLKWEVEFEA